MIDTIAPEDIFAFPVSFAQQRLWFLDQLQPGNPAYNIAAAVRLTGHLDVEALERSLNEIVRRHEALRTTFDVVDESPVQLIHPEVKLPLPLVLLEAATAEEREAEFRRLSAEEAARPFDLRRAPLLRTTLLKAGAEEHYLLVTMHHIVSDGWSVWVFAKELTAHYEAFAAGREPELAELPVQYADFSHWQREWLAGEPLERQLAYWREQLADAPAVLQLPADRARPVAQTFRGERRSAVLNEGLTAALKELSRREGATPYMTLLAAFQLLLQRLSGQEDISVGTPVAGRTRAETEGLIGFFVNTLVMRTRLGGDPTFRELLGRVRQSSLDGYANQDVPFEKLLEELQPERSLSHSPLFQVFFNMLNFPDRSILLPGLAAEVILPPEVEAKFDLTLYVEERFNRFHLDLVHNADLFDPERAAEMLEQYTHLLAQVAADPGMKVGRFSLVTPRAASVLPDPAEHFEPEWCGSVTSQFSARAARDPERDAVVDRHEAWSYGELNKHANRLAHYLIDCGVEQGDTVAVFAHRSAPLVWALLGTLKAGAAFVSLDPAYPPARLIDYMEMARPRAFIHVEGAGPLDPALEEYASALTLPCRIRLPSAATAAACGLLADYPTTNPPVWVGPDDLAYISFTSGSTGRPKGIMGRHGSLAHFAPWAERTFGLNETENFSMLSGLSHDPLHRDIFTPLQLGACVCVPDDETFAGPGLLAGWMERQRITVANLTPAMGQLVSETAPGEDPPRLIPTLRHAFYVGDVLTRRDVARLRRRAPLATCVNLYGATETQRAVSYYVVPASGEPFGATETLAAAEKEVVPLGRGIKEVQLLVLNAAGQMAGVGELGEIYFRSPHLALGYLGDEALTRERFLVNPFTGAASDRLYRTGDLGRYLPDGDVVPSGRADQQVKIRGFRIELGEIEAALGQHPSIKEAVVVAREDGGGEKRLVAYYTTHEGQPTAPAGELRTHLKVRLPEYMIPVTWVVLERLPLTPNGKVDRKALPAPEASRPGDSDGYVAPRTPAEELLCAVWSELLGVERVGVEDNFFELGGHSLLVTQVVSRVR
ncbi:MAG: amino acid adenylation domain-containing protein, partial [Acidobacteria bacterium]|nr:amino acid adenylation domain-containing protein [Acidobacteriota bacterium]